MKLLSLDLTAFGAFSGTTLDFSSRPQGLHIIYGANEAGKSTTRRAIHNVLFGIPERTNDAFLHNTDQLRIGVQLLNGDGETLYCVRRKGRKNTLLDADNKPLDESCLQAFLGNINDSQFSNLFCFDHEQLREGGEALLNGGGDVGESLFAAGTGDTQLHALLSELDREAAELFKARASKPRLNQSIRAYKEACQRMQENSLSVTRWTEQAHALEAAREQHTELSEQLRALHAEQHRLTRIQRTLPLLKRRQTLSADLSELTNVILLPDDVSTQRIQLSSTLHTAQAQAQQASQSTQELQQSLDTLQVPSELLAEKATLYSLYERLGSHQKAARDIPGVRTEMRTVEGEAETLLRHIYPDLALDAVAELNLTQAQRDHLKQLADEQPILREKQAGFVDRLEKVTQQLAQQQASLDNLPSVPESELSALKAALARALKQGELEAQLTQTDREVRRLGVQTDIELKQLGLWTGTLAELEQTALPAAERIENFDQRFKEIETDRQRIKDRLIEARRRASEATQKLEALRWAGAVPTEADLQQVRASREQQWQSLKHTQANAEAYQAFEEAMAQADEVADRLRREAHRVAEQATLLAEQHTAQREQEQQAKKWHSANELLTQLQSEWENCWQASGVKPWSPPEMRAWLTQCLQLRQLAAKLREQRQTLEDQQRLIASVCNELASALAELPERVIPLTRLNDLIEQAQASLAEYHNLQQQREELSRQVRNLSLEQQRLETAHEQASQALSQWQQEWAKALQPIRLPAETSVATLRTVLNTLDQIFNKIERIHGLRRRIERMDEDAEVFRHDVLQLTQKLAPELLNYPVEHIVPDLSNRLSLAERDATRQEQLQQRLDNEQQRQSQAAQQLEQARAQLNALFEQAHCENLTALEAAEQASAHKRLLQQQLHEVEQQLVEQGEGLSLTELANAVAAVDMDQLPGQVQHSQEQVQTLEYERSELDQKIGELRTLLKQMDGNAYAAKAADEAQLALAEMQDLSERYMQVHLAATVLRRSIDRYREQHQGPLLRRTSQLFQHLTLDNFQGVKSGFNGNSAQPVLFGLRQHEEIPTSGMSEGSRDQLFLALRLASLEQYLVQHGTLPLIVDDILVNFDDQRSSATLQVLAELAEQTQILFFTHHQHLVELARESVADELLQVHAL